MELRIRGKKRWKLVVNKVGGAVLSRVSMFHAFCESGCVVERAYCSGKRFLTVIFTELPVMG